MSTGPDIQVPQLAGESARAFEARLRYCTLGPERSLDKVGQQLGKSRALMERWSSRYDWPQHARAYDAVLATVQAQQAAAAYLALVEEHRKRYQDTGKALHGVAMRLLKRLHAELDTMPLSASTLAVVAKAVTVAADLEAHALRVGDLMARLGTEPAAYRGFRDHEGVG